MLLRFVVKKTWLCAPLGKQNKTFRMQTTRRKKIISLLHSIFKNIDRAALQAMSHKTLTYLLVDFWRALNKEHTFIMKVCQWKQGQRRIFMEFWFFFCVSCTSLVTVVFVQLTSIDVFGRRNLTHFTMYEAFSKVNTFWIYGSTAEHNQQSNHIDW